MSGYLAIGPTVVRVITTFPTERAAEKMAASLNAEDTAFQAGEDMPQRQAARDRKQTALTEFAVTT